MKTPPESLLLQYITNGISLQEDANFYIKYFTEKFFQKNEKNTCIPGMFVLNYPGDTDGPLPKRLGTNIYEGRRQI